MLIYKYKDFQYTVFQWTALAALQTDSVISFCIHLMYTYKLGPMCMTFSSFKNQINHGL